MLRKKERGMEWKLNCLKQEEEEEEEGEKKNKKQNKNDPFLDSTEASPRAVKKQIGYISGFHLKPCQILT